MNKDLALQGTICIDSNDFLSRKWSTCFNHQAVQSSSQEVVFCCCDTRAVCVVICCLNSHRDVMHSRVACLHCELNGPAGDGNHSQEENGRRYARGSERGVDLGKRMCDRQQRDTRSSSMVCFLCPQQGNLRRRRPPTRWALIGATITMIKYIYLVFALRCFAFFVYNM